MDRTEKKALFIFAICVIIFFILFHGNEIGDFRNTDKVDSKLFIILFPVCLICSVPILVFFEIGEFLKTLNLKEKILTIVIILVFNLILMLLLSGIVLYVDYFTTNKQWRIEKVDFINKETYGGGKGGESYRYLVKIKDSTLMLDSNVDIPVEQVLNLKECKTNLGMIIFDRYNDSKQ